MPGWPLLGISRNILGIMRCWAVLRFVQRPRRPQEVRMLEVFQHNFCSHNWHRSEVLNFAVFPTNHCRINSESVTYVDLDGNRQQVRSQSVIKTRSHLVSYSWQWSLPLIWGWPFSRRRLNFVVSSALLKRPLVLCNVRLLHCNLGSNAPFWISKLLCYPSYLKLSGTWVTMAILHRSDM